MSPQQKLETLIAKLEQLQKAHQNTSIEIVRLREEVSQLKNEFGISTKSPVSSRELSIDQVPVTNIKEDEIPEIKIDFEKKRGTTLPPPLPKTSKNILQSPPKKTKKVFNIEEFIGGNLINKIGILILIVGLGLFVKYAIDNGYFPPLVRLILSFLAGLTLVGIGYWLKPKYKTYSAVLFSGGMAVLYFSTYSGHAFYDPVLMPRTTAFILMVVFTIVTVLAAMMYGLEIIALLGLVGAYAVPLLLSDDSGAMKLFLSYIAIINSGVLLVCIRNNWRLTLYTAFVLTWLIFGFWVLSENLNLAETNIAWLFNIIFFLIFYTALISYNILKNKKFTFDNVLFVTLNAFIFYGLGMTLLENSDLEKYQGLFTLANGILHLGIAYGMYKKLADKKLFFAISGLFWVFLTIAIGVQFEGDISAILWLGEAAILFGIGRRFKIRLYEGASFLVLFFGISFLLQTWNEGYYDSAVHHGVVFNRYFLISFLAMAITGAMLWMHRKWNEEWQLTPILNLVIPLLFIGIVYFSFFNETFHQFDQAFLNSEIENTRDWDILNFRTVWLINYTFLFVMLLMLFNQVYFKNKILAGFLGGLTVFVFFIFLSAGIFALNDLRYEYLNPDLNPMFQETGYWIWIRYLTYVFAGATLFGLYKLLNWLDDKSIVRTIFQLFVYLVILIILSTELTTFMTMVIGVDTKSLTHQVGFSILWAVYSLVMILVGFRQRSKLLRISGIILFAITLIKVFFIDLINISTESRILLFVAIGILLLVTSYFYQRFAHVFLGNEEAENDTLSQAELRENEKSDE